LRRASIRSRPGSASRPPVFSGTPVRVKRFRPLCIGQAEARYASTADESSRHADTHAARVAQATAANAVTAGPSLLRPGRYAPETPVGDHLLAHELHIAQRAASRARRNATNTSRSRPLLGAFGIDMTTAVIGGNPQ